LKLHTIIISRTDAIGDVILTLPMVTLLKKLFGEETRIIFFGDSYTQPVIECCRGVSAILDYSHFKTLNVEEQAVYLKKTGADIIIHVFPKKDIARAAKKAGIRIRIGTTNRLYHWFNCNRLVWLSRKNSSLHEAQLNVKLLKPLGHSGEISLNEIPPLYNFSRTQQCPEKYCDMLDAARFNLVLHPKSNVSAREWNTDHYGDLIRFLPQDKFKIFITGSKNEKERLQPWISTLPAQVVNLCGALTLSELISFTKKTDGLIAASTGPLHIAAACGIHALGIYPPIKPMHPGRWAPVGSKAEYVVVNKNCTDCRNRPQACHCINEVTSDRVETIVRTWRKE
jgi:heptosyltransferase III